MRAPGRVESWYFQTYFLLLGQEQGTLMAAIIFAWGNWRRWPKVFGGGMGALLLTTVPALAVIYTGKWIVRQSQTGGAPKAVINTSDPSVLIVDMGTNNRANSTSTVVARRELIVPVPLKNPNRNSGSRLFVNHSYSAVMKDGSIAVTTICIIPCGKPEQLNRFFQNVDRPFARIIGANRTFNGLLKPGFYTLQITIRYVNRQGFWDNYTSGSPHRFAVSSV
jgi:hypothetical protein